MSKGIGTRSRAPASPVTDVAGGLNERHLAAAGDASSIRSTELKTSTVRLREAGVGSQHSPHRCLRAPVTDRCEFLAKFVRGERRVRTVAKCQQTRLQQPAIGGQGIDVGWCGGGHGPQNLASSDAPVVCRETSSHRHGCPVTKLPSVPRVRGQVSGEQSPDGSNPDRR